MADVLTQLQDCLEQLSNQFTASINYINLNAPVPTFSSQPDHLPPPNSPPTATADRSQPIQAPSTTLTQSQTALPNANTNAPPSQSQNNAANEPRSPSLAAAQQELAQDLIKKTQQMEALIGILPGLRRSQEAQETRIAALEEELKAVEAERKVAVGEREEAIEVLERVIAGVRR